MASQYFIWTPNCDGIYTDHSRLSQWQLMSVYIYSLVLGTPSNFTKWDKIVVILQSFETPVITYIWKVLSPSQPNCYPGTLTCLGTFKEREQFCSCKQNNCHNENKRRSLAKYIFICSQTFDNQSNPGYTSTIFSKITVNIHVFVLWSRYASS